MTFDNHETGAGSLWRDASAASMLDGSGGWALRSLFPAASRGSIGTMILSGRGSFIRPWNLWGSAESSIRKAGFWPESRIPKRVSPYSDFMRRSKASTAAYH